MMLLVLFGSVDEGGRCALRLGGSGEGERVGERRRRHRSEERESARVFQQGDWDTRGRDKKWNSPTHQRGLCETSSPSKQT